MRSAEVCPKIIKIKPLRRIFCRLQSGGLTEVEKNDDGKMKEPITPRVITPVRNNPSDFVCLCDRAPVSAGARFYFAGRVFSKAMRPIRPLLAGPEATRDRSYPEKTGLPW